MRHETDELAGGDGVALFRQCWYPDGEVAGVAVLAHGLAEHSGRYRGLAEQLTERGCALHAFDMRGHGRSPGHRCYVTDFAALIDDLGRAIDSARRRHPSLRLALIGHSYGGAVALAAVLERPTLADLLVLSAPAVAADPDVPRTRLVLGRLLSKLRPRTGILHLPAAAVSRDPSVVRSYEEDPLVYRGPIPARTLVGLLATMQRIEARAGELRPPTLVLHGTEDSLVPLRFNRRVYERLGAADLTIRLYDGLYHEVFNEPERREVLDDLQAWLSARALSRTRA